MRALLLCTTALAFFPADANAAPVALAFATSLAGSAISAAVAGTALVWSSALSTATLAAVGAGVSSLMGDRGGALGPGSREITLNAVQPVTEGLILYGERILGGSITARSVTSAGGKTNGRYHMVMPLACHEIDGAVAVWLGEQKVWTAEQFALDEGTSGDQYRWGQIASDYFGKFRLRIYNGTADQEADPRYVEAASEWTVTARGRGIAYVYFEADFDPDIYPTGPEELRVLVRGKRVYDPREDITRYSDNPALCLRDYALTPETRGGIGWGASDINEAAIIALANLADEPIPVDRGGTETRYAFNGVLDTASAPEANLDRLATSWGGWWSVDRGQLTVGGGAHAFPSFEITESVINGPVRVMARRPFEQQFNQVKALFADPGVEFTATDLPVLKSATYKAEDNGEDLIKDLGEFSGETSFARGQRLQKLALLKGRRQKRAEIPCNLSAWNINIGDVVEVTLPRRGWAKKLFEVERRVVQIEPGNVGVRLSLIETSAAIYDWTTGEEMPKPAGGATTLPSPFSKPIVTAPQTTETLYETRGGGGVKLRVNLTSSSFDPFVEEWQFSWRLSSENADDATLGAKQPTPELVLDDVKPGTYVFGVRARNRRGLWGDWVYASPEVIEGRNDPPAPLRNFSVQALGAIALAKWDRHPSLDVQQGGEIEFRHAVDSAASWTTSTTIARAVQGVMTEAPLPLKAGVYLARAKDSQGVVSGTVSFVVTRTGLDGLSPLFVQEEAPDFAGVKINVTRSGNEILLDEGVNTGSIGFAELIDLGAVRDVRAICDIRARVADPTNAFGHIGVPFGTTRPFGTSGGAEGDAQLWIRATTLDPAQASDNDWGPWQRLDVADLTGRGFQAECRLSAEGADYLVAVSGLKLSIFG